MTTLMTMTGCDWLLLAAALPAAAAASWAGGRLADYTTRAMGDHDLSNLTARDDPAGEQPAAYDDQP